MAGTGNPIPPTERSLNRCLAPPQVRAPGRTCSANVISDAIAACDSTRRPLDPEQSRAVIDRNPPFDRCHVTLFSEKYGRNPGG